MADNDHQCLSAIQMADRLGISINSLNKQRSVKPDQGPPFFHMGKRVLYPLNGQHGFEAWMAARMQGGAISHG
jgi:hypothetical protein